MTPCLKEKEDYEWTKNGLDYTREKGDQGDKGDHGVGVAKCSAFDFFHGFLGLFLVRQCFSVFYYAKKFSLKN